MGILPTRFLALVFSRSPTFFVDVAHEFAIAKRAHHIAPVFRRAVEIPEFQRLLQRFNASRERFESNLWIHWFDPQPVGVTDTPILPSDVASGPMNLLNRSVSTQPRG